MAAEPGSCRRIDHIRSCAFGPGPDIFEVPQARNQGTGQGFSPLDREGGVDRLVGQGQPMPTCRDQTPWALPQLDCCCDGESLGDVGGMSAQALLTRYMALAPCWPGKVVCQLAGAEDVRALRAGRLCLLPRPPLGRMTDELVAHNPLRHAGPGVLPFLGAHRRPPLKTL